MRKSIILSNENICIPCGQRPFWTYHNRRGNCGPHLTNMELKKYGLLSRKEYKFDEIWFESNKGRKRIWWERWKDKYLYWI